MIEWKNSYNTGIDSIDRQHKKLLILLDKAVVLANKNDISSSSLNKECTAIFEELTAYSEYHFNYEEELMKETKFSGYDGHRDVHQEFKEQILLFLSEEDPEPVRIAVYLQEWLIRHIAGMDRDYILHFKKNLVN